MQFPKSAPVGKSAVDEDRGSPPQHAHNSTILEERPGGTSISRVRCHELGFFVSLKFEFGQREFAYENFPALPLR